MVIVAEEFQSERFYVLRQVKYLNPVVPRQDGVVPIQATYQTHAVGTMRKQKDITGSLYDLIKACWVII